MNSFQCSRRALVRTGFASFFILLLSGFSISVLADAFTLREEAPVIVQLPEAPRDTGHRHSFADLKVDSSQLQSGNSQSVTEGTAGHVLLGHPLRKGISNPRPGFYAISNYVDQDPDAPDMLLDYECGERTYDLEDGFNHNGIDYFNFPFSWLAMDQDASIVVAAADGVIIEKSDGNNDMNCALEDTTPANQVVLEHSDGSVTVYTHLKRNSTTSLGVGDMVEKGDYIGVVGSSGFSTGPHLHFGVYDAFGSLIEPHDGACNTLNNDSWWEDQEDYYVSQTNFVASHTEVPEIPPCPGIENPHLEDNFSPGDTVFLSAFFRDIITGDVTTQEVRDSGGNVLLTWDFEYSDPEHGAALMVVWGVDLPSNAASGAYTFRVIFEGTVQEHTFYINSGPNPPPVAKDSNNAANGLFFDIGLDGEGYNFVTTPAGTIIYFYGSDKNGNRLWLISDLIRGDFGPGTVTEVTMYESTGGTFGSPVASNRGLSVWGVLILEFGDCNNAVAVLSGVDGDKVSQLTKLAGVAGTACTGAGSRADAAWSGLWYALALEGEGYNVVVAPNGVIIYFYGFKSSGKRSWLISDLITAELEVGVEVEIAVFEATQGDFDNPAPSSQLVQWGTARVTVDDCGHITIVLLGNDGSKTSNTVRLAGVIGLECSD